MWEIGSILSVDCLYKKKIRTWNKLRKKNIKYTYVESLNKKLMLPKDIKRKENKLKLNNFAYENKEQI